MAFSKNDNDLDNLMKGIEELDIEGGQKEVGEGQGGQDGGQAGGQDGEFKDEKVTMQVV